MEESSGRNRFNELEQVIVEFQDQLFRFAFYRTGSLADAQDIVQDVFIKLYRDASCILSVKNLKGYLIRCVANACTDYQRTDKRNRFEQLDKATIPLEQHEGAASDILMLIEEYNRIEAMLRELPNDQAEIIRLRILDDLSFVEIGQLLEIPTTTAKSRFKYGIDKLKSKIEKKKEAHYEL